MEDWVYLEVTVVGERAGICVSVGIGEDASGDGGGGVGLRVHLGVALSLHLETPGKLLSYRPINRV